MQNRTTSKTRYKTLRRTAQLLCISLFIIALQPATARPADNDAGPIEIYTAIAPLACIIANIGGPYVSVKTLLREGQDPHLFEPTPRELYRLSQAQIYLLSGLPFEHILVKKISGQNVKLSIIDITSNITYLSQDSHHHIHSPSEAPGDESLQAEPDPHFWLGIVQLRQYINTVADVIIKTDPQHSAFYRQNTARLLSRLESVHARNLTRLSHHRNRVFFAYHPAFSYFASTYGLQQQTIERQGRQPGPRAISALIKQARSAGVRTLFVQPQYDKKSAEAVAAAINGNIVLLDPLACDVIQNLEHIARAIANSFNQIPVHGQHAHD